MDTYCYKICIQTKRETGFLQTGGKIVIPMSLMYIKEAPLGLRASLKKGKAGIHTGPISVIRKAALRDTSSSCNKMGDG